MGERIAVKTSEEVELKVASRTGKEKGRFKVNVVHYQEPDDDPDSPSAQPFQSGRAQETSRLCENTHNLRTFGRNTNEALPHIDFYRNTGSVENKYKRPTLAQLRGDETKPLTKSEGHVNDQLKEVKPVLKFGWIQGVLVRCLLNIWGVMLFLRLSWVTGQAGIGLATAIILLATLVTTLTTLSMSAICTNGEVKGGGTYYMISRSMGPEFGGAIGIVFSFANAVAVAMHVVGFAETMRDILQEHNITLIDFDNDVRIIGVMTVTLLLIIALIGMEWEARAQIGMLLILVVSIMNFIIGALLPPDDDKRKKGVTGLYRGSPFFDNLSPNFSDGQDFFSIFAIFFPAATGILAGANISGDLKNPSTAIPKGTLLAILISSLVYIAFVWICGATVVRDAVGGMDVSNGTDAFNCTVHACHRGLMNDFRVIEVVSGWGPIIIAGAFAATLSSALAALVSAPKIFQALSKDRIFPYIHVFAKGYGPTDEPRRGYLLTFAIAVGFILIGKLNIIAPLISNFFLMSYAIVNFACFDASLAKSPSWRPAFRFYNMYLSLFGSLCCISAMFLMQWYASLITFAIVAAIYGYVHYKKPDVNWGSSTQAHVYNSALNSTLKLASSKEHVKNFRPQVLLLCGLPSCRPALVDFVNSITKNISLMVCANVMQESHADGRSLLLSHTHHKVAHIYDLMQKRKVKGFYSYVSASSLRRGVQILLQSTGLGKLRPNVLMMGFKQDWLTASADSVEQYVNIIHDAFDMHYGVGLLHVKEGFDVSQYLTDDAAQDILFSPSAMRKSKRSTVAGASRQQQQLLARDASSASMAATVRPSVAGGGSTFVGSAAAAAADTIGISVCLSKDRLLSPGGNVAFAAAAIADTAAAAVAVDGNGTLAKSCSADNMSQPDELSYVDVDAFGEAAEAVDEHDDEEDVISATLLSEAIDKNVLQMVNMFHHGQKQGTIDVWWLFDDGGLTLLLPYILSTNSHWRNCKIRVFMAGSKKMDLNRDQKNMATLLSKFRIDYDDMEVIPTFGKKPQQHSLGEFQQLLNKWQAKESDSNNTDSMITDVDIEVNKEKTNRHIRFRELVLEKSQGSSLIVLTLPVPRKGTCPAGLYMAWLDMLTRGMPAPVLLLRGNQESVLTYYS